MSKSRQLTNAAEIADLRATARAQAQAQDRRIETSTLPAPLDIDDETVQRFHRAVQAVTARIDRQRTKSAESRA